MLEQTPLRAKFRIQGRAGSEFEVHFNPDSLSYTVSNQLKNTGSGDSAKQFVSQSTGKLSLELLFDTTASGEDVRIHSLRVARLMEPQEDKTPPVVDFEWGEYVFSGMLESFKEKLDFFAPEGIPLRAAVSITLSRQDQVFSGQTDKRVAVGGRLAEAFRPPAVEAEADPGGDGRGLTGTATRGGDPAAARDLGRRNGIENLRFPAARTVLVDDAPRPAGAPALTPSGSADGRLRRPAQRARRALAPTAFLAADETRAGVPERFGPGGKMLAPVAGARAEVGRVGALKDLIAFEGEDPWE